MTATLPPLSVEQAPHGGTLIDRYVPDDEAPSFVDAAASLPSLSLNLRGLCDLDLIACGAFSPLTGFMGASDYNAVAETMRLAGGAVWSLPITLPATPEEARSFRQGQRLALRDGAGAIAGELTVDEIFQVDLEREALAVFQTVESAHPGVVAIKNSGSWRVAGTVRALRRPLSPALEPYHLTPAETRASFAARGWRTIVGFQTRNPLHRSHEYIQKAALEVVDGLLLHPLVGETKPDDVPADVRMRCYEVVLENYFPARRSALAVLPASMRYAGPREAVHHALMRQNYGCTHFIVGRDHAGVGNYYGTYDSQLIFSNFQPGEIGITPLFFEHTFYCRRCDAHVSAKTCPHDTEQHVTLSGTKVRQMLSAGVEPPATIMRPEVAQVLTAHGADAASRNQRKE